MTPFLNTARSIGRDATASAMERRGQDKKVGFRADLKRVRAAEHRGRRVRRQREGLLQICVATEVLTVADDASALQHVAVAERRPGVADIVRAAEHPNPVALQAA